MVDEEPMNPALLMFLSFRRAETKILEHLAVEGFGDLTLAQGRVAARIGPEGTRLTDLAEQAQVTKQSAGSLVDQLERAGYVTREPDPSDARARLVCLAERGRQAQRAAREMERQIEVEWEHHLGATTMRQLCAALTSLREITDPWA
ncbi:MarR family winged helix-turn-helix transcriptional regulator [Nocardioides jensenii]|uniref:MarR family winged helix-turn-helix transcriptional regulator n=1 Tax=Nocardioides jensenii TaxID=1843 RepID=UPI00082FC417|nr:MarR family transcriptional regulator [Nocardioides jensenii]